MEMKLTDKFRSRHLAKQLCLQLEHPRLEYLESVMTLALDFSFPTKSRPQKAAKRTQVISFCQPHEKPGLSFHLLAPSHDRCRYWRSGSQQADSSSSSSLLFSLSQVNILKNNTSCFSVKNLKPTVSSINVFFMNFLNCSILLM